MQGMQGMMPQDAQQLLGQGVPPGAQAKFAETSQAVAGIAKNMSWKWLFFGGAACTLAAAVINILVMIVHHEFEPFSFTTVLFLLVFGFLMLVLDFPIPHPSESLAAVRAGIYKFLLFMTRFTGRGIWYLFLGSLIFATLVDLKISAFFGIILAGYVGILGVVALFFGLHLSLRLEKVRQVLLIEKQQCPGHGFDPSVFKNICKQSAQQDFTDDELAYIFNSLSFSSGNDGIIKPDEYNAWLSPGKMEIV